MNISELIAKHIAETSDDKSCGHLRIELWSDKNRAVEVYMHKNTFTVAYKNTGLGNRFIKVILSTWAETEALVVSWLENAENPQIAELQSKISKLTTELEALRNTTRHGG